MTDKPTKLVSGEVHMMRLVEKGQQCPEGWAPVSKPVMALMRKMPERLVELQEADEGRGRARLTAEGESVLNAMSLGYEAIKAQVAGRKRVQVYRRLRSTTDLSVKQMSEYLDRFIAFATDDLAVVFEFDLAERETVRYRRPARAQRKPEPATA